MLKDNMKVNVYNETGKKKEAVNLPDNIVADSNMAILAQAIRVFENRKHPGLAKVKTRGEITASTHKIYRQKGTGGARHGAKSAPIFVGGGVAHGPTGQTRTLSMPAKMRARALEVALGLKAKEGKLLIVEGISKLGKTKEAQKLLDSIIKSEELKNRRFVVALSGKNVDVRKYLRNVRNVHIFPYINLNAYHVFFGGTVLLDADALDEGKQYRAKNVDSKKEFMPVTKKVVKTSTKAKSGKVTKK